MLRSSALNEVSRARLPWRVVSITWSNARLLPVRVLGVCGGYVSDIAAGMRWAAGLPVPGVPANTQIAKVLNLSLGRQGNCSPTFQDAVT